MTSATSSKRSPVRLLKPANIGAVYLLVALAVVFSIGSPHVFASYGTVQQVLNEYAVTGLVALGLILPLSAGVYDLSVGSVVGLSGVSAAWFLAHVNPNPFLGVVAGIVVALVIGAVNIVVVIRLKVDSFIGTLATSSIAGALLLALSGSNVITKNVTGGFTEWLGIKSVVGLTLPVGFLVLAMLVLGFFMERSPFGRHVYATGFDREVARLGGVDVGRLQSVTLLVSAAMAGLAGVCITASLGAGDPTVGPGYLLPAFAAAFLGATQFRNGRFNPWGTVVAVMLLGTGNIGLLIIGAPVWTPSIFDGAILILAVALTASRGVPVLNRFRRRRPPVAPPAPTPTRDPSLTTS